MEPADILLNADLSRRIDAVHAGAGRLFRVRTQVGFLNVHSQPDNPHRCDNVVAQLHEGQIVQVFFSSIFSAVCLCLSAGECADCKWLRGGACRREPLEISCVNAYFVVCARICNHSYHVCKHALVRGCVTMH